MPLTVNVLLAMCDGLQHPGCVPHVDLLPRPDVSLGHHLHQPLIRANQREACICIKSIAIDRRVLRVLTNERRVLRVLLTN